MNANQIINMVMRIVMRRVIGGGINAGINAMGHRLSKGKGETRDVPHAGEAQKRMRQTMRATRRMGRF